MIRSINRSISGIDYTQSLLFKTWLKQHPWLAIYIVIIVFIFAAGYLCHVLDRKASSLLCYRDFSDNGDTLLDRFWLLIVTFQTSRLELL